MRKILCYDTKIQFFFLLIFFADERVLFEDKIWINESIF